MLFVATASPARDESWLKNGCIDLKQEVYLFDIIDRLMKTWYIRKVKLPKLPKKTDGMSLKKLWNFTFVMYSPRMMGVLLVQWSLYLITHHTQQ